MTAFRLTHVLAALCVMLAVRAQAAPASRQQTYLITRDGSPIGRQVVDTTTDGRTTTVDFTTTITVKILSVTAYSYQYRAREIWTDDRFASFRSATNDNGAKHNVAITRMPDHVEIVADSGRFTAPAGALPASFWNVRFLETSVLIDTDNGRVVPVTFRDLGKENLRRGALSRAAHRYRIGGLDRDVWFDGADLVRFEMRGSDGSTILSEIQ